MAIVIRLKVNEPQDYCGGAPLRHGTEIAARLRRVRKNGRSLIKHRNSHQAEMPSQGAIGTRSRVEEVSNLCKQA